MTPQFMLGVVAGVLGLLTLAWLAALWSCRHRHDWTVWAVAQQVRGSAVHYADFLDRCPCGRMRMRRRTPLPTWWPMGARLDPPRESWEYRQLLDAMPRFEQRKVRAYLQRRLADAERDETKAPPARQETR